MKKELLVSCISSTDEEKIEKTGAFCRHTNYRCHVVMYGSLLAHALYSVPRTARRSGCFPFEIPKLRRSFFSRVLFVCVEKIYKISLSLSSSRAHDHEHHFSPRTTTVKLKILKRIPNWITRLNLLLFLVFKITFQTLSSLTIACSFVVCVFLFDQDQQQSIGIHEWIDLCAAFWIEFDRIDFTYRWVCLLLFKYSS